MRKVIDYWTKKYAMSYPIFLDEYTFDYSVGSGKLILRGDCDYNKVLYGVILFQESLLLVEDIISESGMLHHLAQLNPIESLCQELTSHLEFLALYQALMVGKFRTISTPWILYATTADYLTLYYISQYHRFEKCKLELTTRTFNVSRLYVEDLDLQKIEKECGVKIVYENSRPQLICSSM